MMSVKCLIIFAASMALSCAQSDIQSALGSATLPPELQGKVDPKELESAKNKTLEQVKARCEKNGGPEAYAKAQNASQELTQCVSALVNVTALQQEVESAKPNGNVDEVFKKYCDKKPLFEDCIKNFTDSSKACFSEKERVHLNTVYNVSQQLADFICFKEGDRIALFIAEGGQECFTDKQQELQQCVNNTLGLKADLDINSISTDNVQLTFDEKQCKQLSELQSCVVRVLETCPKPTSANIVESLFKFIRKSTPCKQFTKKEEETKARSHKAVTEQAKKGATSSFVATATILTAFVTTLLV